MLKDDEKLIDHERAYTANCEPSAGARDFGLLVCCWLGLWHTNSYTYNISNCACKAGRRRYSSFNS